MDLGKEDKRRKYFTIENISNRSPVSTGFITNWKAILCARSLEKKTTADWRGEGSFLGEVSFQKSSICINEPNHEEVVNWIKLQWNLARGDWPVSCWGHTCILILSMKFSSLGCPFPPSFEFLAALHCPLWKHFSCFNRLRRNTKPFLCFQELDWDKAGVFLFIVIYKY